jgi:cell division septum initiation protein DivIVA
MGQFGVEQSSEKVPVAQRADGSEESPEAARASREESLREREELLEKVRRLEEELERYRQHAQRTSKLFLSATSYAEWVRERARRDAELVLRKARARAEKTLGGLEHERERTERELLRLQALIGETQKTLADLELERERTEPELVRLQALTGETRARLSAFLTAALQVLNAEVEAGQGDGSKSALADLQETLQKELVSAPQRASAQLAETDGPER